MIIDLNQVFNGYPIPVAHDHFATSQKPPFLAWNDDTTDNVKADNKVWYKVTNYDVNLYTRQDTNAEEERLEKWLDEHGICWERVSRTWDDKEKMYWSVYDIY